jgi:hypothetical protein
VDGQLRAHGPDGAVLEDVYAIGDVAAFPLVRGVSAPSGRLQPERGQRGAIHPSGGGGFRAPERFQPSGKDGVPLPAALLVVAGGPSHGAFEGLQPGGCNGSAAALRMTMCAWTAHSR